MSTRNLALRHTIRKATIKDCGLINRLAWKAFPPTYQAILPPELQCSSRSVYDALDV